MLPEMQRARCSRATKVHILDKPLQSIRLFSKKEKCIKEPDMLAKVALFETRYFLKRSLVPKMTT